MSTPTKMMTDADLAEILGIQEKTIRNRMAAGEDMPPYVRIGRTRRWRADLVEAWIEARTYSDRSEEAANQ